ncbi:hypothetical protein PybrP1_000447 [[Pythium] brassicae (nom. inval.)]|nr:hypothetical protein PybrP1_000447 [[Pythium] brassicae (nom. inval.)]
MKLVSASIASALLAVHSLSLVNAHSYLVKPVSRETEAYSDFETKVGCPHMTPGQSTSFKAGETIDVRYWRNNHVGGFIRWSFVARGQETKENLDKNVFHYSCRESGATCVPTSGEATKWASDGSGGNTVACGDKITLPDWLPAGDYVLQWTWFAVGSKEGDLNWEEAKFRSCADIKLTSSGAKSAAPKCPTFTGGDRVTKLTNSNQDKCFYFHSAELTNSLFRGDKPENYEKNYFFGIPADVEKCRAASGGNSTAPATPSSTPKPPALVPATKTPGCKAKTPTPKTGY